METRQLGTVLADIIPIEIGRRSIHHVVNSRYRISHRPGDGSNSTHLAVGEFERRAAQLPQTRQ